MSVQDLGHQSPKALKWTSTFSSHNEDDWLLFPADDLHQLLLKLITRRKFESGILHSWKTIKRTVKPPHFAFFVLLLTRTIIDQVLRSTETWLSSGRETQAWLQPMNSFSSQCDVVQLLCTLPSHRQDFSFCNNCTLTSTLQLLLQLSTFSVWLKVEEIRKEDNHQRKMYRPHTKEYNFNFWKKQQQKKPTLQHSASQ